MSNSQNNSYNQEVARDSVLEMSSSDAGSGGSFLVADTDLENGRTTQRSSGCQAADLDEDELTCGIDGDIVDGDPVNTTLFDVDDDIVDTMRPGEAGCTQDTTDISIRERNLAGGTSSITPDSFHVDETFEDEFLTLDKSDGALSPHRDIDNSSDINNDLDSESSLLREFEFGHSCRNHHSMLVTPDPPPPPAELPPSNSHPPSTPGAFPMTPRNVVDVDGDDETVGTVQVLSEAANMNWNSQERHAGEDMLVHATLVEDGDAVDASMLRPNSGDQEEASNNIEVIEASPLDYPPRTFQESILRSKWTQCNILALIGLISAAVALGFIALEPPPQTVTISTQAPSSSSQGWRTLPPTFAHIDTEDVEALDEEQDLEALGNGQPKGSALQETMAPLSRDEVYGLLPEHTQQTLKWAGSPQYQAFEWVWRDPDLSFYSLDRLMQRFAMMTVLVSAGYVDLRSMTEDQIYSGRNECNWTSGLRTGRVLLCNADGQFTGIFLARSNLQGTIAEELSMLSMLEDIDLSGNNLTGPLPDTIGQLLRLKTMHLCINAFTGTLPYTLSSMTKLEELDFSGNQFMSSLPGELGYMTSLTHLSLANNGFSGNIPRFFRHLTHLKQLVVDNNKLSGVLPISLGELVSARTISLSSNRLTGTIPESFGLLTNLRELSLSDNLLVGTVPPALGNLHNASILDLHTNSLSGTLPIEVCALQARFGLKEVTVDCEEIECWCSCNCFKDESKIAVAKTP